MFITYRGRENSALKKAVQGKKLLVQDSHEDQSGLPNLWKMKSTVNERPQLPSILAGGRHPERRVDSALGMARNKGSSTAGGDESRRTIDFILLNPCYYRCLQNLHLPKKGECD